MRESFVRSRTSRLLLGAGVAAPLAAGALALGAESAGANVQPVASQTTTTAKPKPPQAINAAGPASRALTCSVGAKHLTAQAKVTSAGHGKVKWQSLAVTSRTARPTVHVDLFGPAKAKWAVWRGIRSPQKVDLGSNPHSVQKSGSYLFIEATFAKHQACWIEAVS